MRRLYYITRANKSVWRLYKLLACQSTEQDYEKNERTRHDLNLFLKLHVSKKVTQDTKLFLLRRQITWSCNVHALEYRTETLCVVHFEACSHWRLSSFAMTWWLFLAPSIRWSLAFRTDCSCSRRRIGNQKEITLPQLIQNRTRDSTSGWTLSGVSDCRILQSWCNELIDAPGDHPFKRASSS